MKTLSLKIEHNMMKKNKNIIFIIIILCLNCTVNCKSLNESFFIKKYILYEQAQKKLKEKNFDSAILILEKIKKIGFDTISKDKTQINLIYAYYKNLNFEMAQKNIVEFMNIYPNHPNIDYVMYIQALINIAQDKNELFNIFPFYYEKNDTHYAQNAFFQLKHLIQRYPKSLYIINAKKDLVYLKNRLSNHDFEILRFYFKNKKYIAVINRGDEIIRKYPETLAARKTLIYMKQSFLALNICKTAKKISKIILLNKIQDY